jgi:hypothetical protein
MLANPDQSEPASWPMSRLGSDLDRRCRPHLRLALPVVLFRSEDWTRIETKTENLTCDSFYCVSERPFSLDEQLECELLIAGDGLSSVPEDDLYLRCQVRVVRVVPKGTKRGFGVACRLEDYTISRSARN